MSFDITERVKRLREQLLVFMDTHVYPNEARFEDEVARDRWKPTKVIEELKVKARQQGLWNLFLTRDENGPGSGAGRTSGPGSSATRR